MAEDNTRPTKFDTRVVFNERTHCKKDLVVREDLHVKEKAILNNVVLKGDVTLKTGKELHESLDEVSTFVTDHKEKIESMLSESSEALDSFKEVVDFLNSGDANLQSAIDTNVSKLSEVVTTLEGKHPTIDADNLLDNALVDGFATLKGRVDTLLEGVTDESLDQVKEIADFIGADDTGLKDLIDVNKSNLTTLSDKHTTLDASVTTLDTTLTDLSDKHTTLDASVTTLDTTLTDLSGNHDTTYALLADLSGNHDTTYALLVDLSGNHDTTYALLADLSGNHNELDVSVTALDSTLTDLSGNHDALNVKHTLLDALADDLSGSHFDLSANVDILINDKIERNDDGHILADGNLLPDVNVTRSLGNTDTRFKELYLGPGTAYVGTTAYGEHGVSHDDPNNNTFTIDYDNIDICGNLDVSGTVTVDGGIAMSGDFTIFGPDNSFNVVCDEIMLDASTVDVCGNVTVAGNLLVDGGIAMTGDFSIFGADNSFNVVCDEIMLDASTVDVCGNVTVSNDLTVTNDLTVSGSATFNAGAQHAPIAVVAQAVGDLGTGQGEQIPAGATFVTATVATDADDIIVLPEPVVGNIIYILAPAGGCELRTSDPSSIVINGGTAAADYESTIAANEFVMCICTSLTSWIAMKMSTNGTPAALEAQTA
jgi:hypothetical protein